MFAAAFKDLMVLFGLLFCGLDMMTLFAVPATDVVRWSWCWNDSVVMLEGHNAI